MWVVNVEDPERDVWDLGIPYAPHPPMTLHAGSTIRVDGSPIRWRVLAQVMHVVLVRPA